MSREKKPSNVAPSADAGKTVFVGAPSTPVDEKNLKTQFAPSSQSKKTPDKAKPTATHGAKTQLVQPSATPQSKKQQQPSSSKNPVQARPKGTVKNQAAALTEIRQSIVKQDNSQGFIKAKSAADKALANNNIVLNRRFVLEKTLGAGGMGTVYKAKDLRKIEADDRNPFVAVKVLNDDFKDHPDAFITLQREASRSHILSHPNIVTVHDFDRDDDIIYMTMELLQGQPLDVQLRDTRGKGALLAEVQPIIANICEALAFAHKKNIVHSDLKPGNIFITDGGAKILDFGIARLTSNTDHFDSGSLGALTPAYASLEMLQGKDPHPSDDLYAIAIITYELLSGKHPYDRTPADQALEKKLKPKKIDSLTKQQWEALSGALQLTREKRTRSVDEFQSAFLVRKKIPVFKIASALLLLALAALAYLFLFALNDVDNHIDQSMEAGNLCFAQNNFVCAKEKYETILELAPDNKDAQQKLSTALVSLKDQRLKTLSSEAHACLQQKQDLVCATAKMHEIQKLAPQSQPLLAIQTAIDDFTTRGQVKSLLTAAQHCISTKNYACAIEKSDQALSLDTKNTQANTIKQTASRALSESNALEAEKNALYSTALAKGNQYLSAQDFDRAIEQFDTAAKLKPQEAEARSLLQSAKFSLQREQESRVKADKLVDKASRCLQRKNFSCAISNAESALEFVPNYKPATAIQRDALKQQEAAKSSFNIQ